MTSHPLAGLPSQSAKPGLQLTNRHAPPEQSLVAFARLHVRPHAPQCAAVVCVLTSQPSAGSMLQSAKPAAHNAMPHTPAVHPAVAFAMLMQPRPHMPQFMTLVCVLVSQPSVASMLQSPNPGAHAPTVHTPIAHADVPFAAMQRFAQRPQFSPLTRRSTSQPSAALLLQSANPGLQVNPHVPVVQTGTALGGVGHRLPQRPQCVSESCVLVSQPLRTSMSQSPKLPEQRPTAHRPIVQVGSALGTMHCVPHIPQFAVFARKSMQASVQQV